MIKSITQNESTCTTTCTITNHDKFKPPNMCTHYEPQVMERVWFSGAGTGALRAPYLYHPKKSNTILYMVQNNKVSFSNESKFEKKKFNYLASQTPPHPHFIKNILKKFHSFHIIVYGKHVQIYKKGLKVKTFKNP